MERMPDGQHNKINELINNILGPFHFDPWEENMIDSEH
jgi:hypothetical protein